MKVTKLKLGQRWKAKNNSTILIVYRKRGSKWKLLREGGCRPKVHTMSDFQVNKYFTLLLEKSSRVKMNNQKTSN